jgi:hypothetical protein
MLLPHVPMPLLAAPSPDSILPAISDALVDLVGAGFGIYMLIGVSGTVVVYARRLGGRLLANGRNRAAPGEPEHRVRSNARSSV